MFFIAPTLFLLLGIIPSAQAYLDPGTGSMIVQIIVGSLLAVTYTLKVYWRRIKKFFRKDK